MHVSRVDDLQFQGLVLSCCCAGNYKSLTELFLSHKDVSVSNGMQYLYKHQHVWKFHGTSMFGYFVPDC